jgi:uncharacterized protein
VKTYYNAEGYRSVYKPLSGLRYFESPKGQKVLVNPETGGWAVVNDTEYHILTRYPNISLTREFGKQAYLCGLASKDGNVCKNTFMQDCQSEIKMIMLWLTPECNLSCSYCYKGKTPSIKSTQIMPELIADRIVEHCTTQSDYSKVVRLLFTGGEPFLEFDFMRKFTRHLRKIQPRNISFKLTVQSNSTLLNNEHIQFILDEDVGYGVSLDGPEYIQNRQRPLLNGKGSYAQVIRSIKILQEAGKEIGVLVVITKESAKMMPEITSHLIELGIKTITFAPVRVMGNARDEMAPDPKEFVNGLYTSLQEVVYPHFKTTNELINERFAATILSFLLSSTDPLSPNMCYKSPCGAATQAIAIDCQNGKVYACDDLPDDEWMLGNLQQASIKEILTHSLVEQLKSRSPKTIVECNKCFAKSWCQCYCPGMALAKNGTIMSPAGQCELSRRAFLGGVYLLADERLDMNFIHLFTKRFTGWNKSKYVRSDCQTFLGSNKQERR